MTPITRITERESSLVRANAAAALSSLGVDDIRSLEPWRLSWSRLKDARNACRSAARTLEQKIPTDDEDRATNLEDAATALMLAAAACQDELDERDAIGSREPRSGPTPPDPRRPIGDLSAVGRGVDDGLGPDTDFRDAPVGLRPEQRFADWQRTRSSGEDYRGLTPGKYLRAMIMGPQNEVERRALSEGTDSAGGYTVPDVLSASMIDLLRAASVVVRGGAMTIPLTSDTNYIAKVASDPSPAWRAENAQVNESDPTFARVTLTPRSLAVMCKVSRELMEDSLNMERMLPRIIASAMAVETDKVALIGTGTAPEPRGVLNQSGINSVAHDATLTSYAPFVSARKAVKLANSDVRAWIMSPRDEATLAGLVDGEGQPLMAPRYVSEIPMLTTTSIPTDLGDDTAADNSVILGGDWSRLMLGVRNQLRIEILRERYADYLQYGIVAHLRMDVAVEQAAAFVAITGVSET